MNHDCNDSGDDTEATTNVAACSGEAHPPCLMLEMDQLANEARASPTSHNNNQHCLITESDDVCRLNSGEDTASLRVEVSTGSGSSMAGHLESKQEIDQKNTSSYSGSSLQC